MSTVGPAWAIRRRRWSSIVMILAIGLGLVSMHQLSVGHHLATESSTMGLTAAHHADDHLSHPGPTDAGSTDAIPERVDSGSAVELLDGVDGIHAMAMVCVLALLIFSALAAVRPPARGILARAPSPTSMIATPVTPRRPRSRIELSVSRC